MSLNVDRFLPLLGNLIGEAEHLQNNPPDFVPQEDRAVKHVRAILDPLSTAHGGPLIIKQVSYAPNRSNLIITYPGENHADPNGPTIGFVGSHMDVVTAVRDQWEKDPFKLTIEGDKLFGRGTTDCLGHVAMLTDLMAHLAETKPKLKRTIVTVFIANEENSSIEGIGVDELVKRGELAHLKNGPLYWVDSADEQPCIGTGGVMCWSLTAHGKIGHSGLPHNAINPIILAYESLAVIMKKFHEEFPAHPEEKRYKYPIPSTMKPTMIEYPKGSLNQIPGTATISGDIRLTPFYDAHKVCERVSLFADEVNREIASLPTQGPANKNVLADGSRGSIEFKWLGEPHGGLACNIDGDGFKKMEIATTKILGSCNPSSLTGSLPCVKELQDAGFDVQVCGYGVMKYYHAANECASLAGFQRGFSILSEIISLYNQ